MATKVYTEEDLTLQDETVVSIRPLNIGRLRRLMKAWKEFEKVGDDEDKSFDVFINCSGIALEHEFKEKFTETRGKGDEVLSSEYREYLEDVLDMDTIYKIMEISAGMKLNDPNLLAAAMSQVEDGTN